MNGSVALTANSKLESVRVNASAPAYEAALTANHVTHEVYRYPGTQDGFDNDTAPHFNKTAAALAWQRTLEFLQKHLGEPNRR